MTYGKKSFRVDGKTYNITITHALTDVDESKIACFDVDGKEIKLITDYTYNEIAIDSEIELKVVKLD